MDLDLRIQDLHLFRTLRPAQLKVPKANLQRNFPISSLAASLISYEHKPERHITKFDLDVLGELASVMDIECVTSSNYNQLYTDLILNFMVCKFHKLKSCVLC